MELFYFRIYTDEDMYGMVARALRERGYDAVTTPEMRNLGLSDAAQLIYAVSQKRVILTFNVHDFVRLHKEYIRRNREHWGIIVSKRLSIGDIVKRLLNLLNSLTAEDMRNRLEYLTDWDPKRIR